MEVQHNERLRQHHQRAVIVSAAMIASIPFYVLVAELLAASNESFQGFAPELPLHLLRGVAVVIGLLLLFAANMFRRRLLEGEGSLAARVTLAMVPQERYSSMFRGTVLTLALCDALALLGLMLFLLGGERQDLYAFATTGLIAAWYHFPRYHQWQRWYVQRSHVR